MIQFHDLKLFLWHAYICPCTMQLGVARARADSARRYAALVMAKHRPVNQVSEPICVQIHPLSFFNV